MKMCTYIICIIRPILMKCFVCLCDSLDSSYMTLDATGVVRIEFQKFFQDLEREKRHGEEHDKK